MVRDELLRDIKARLQAAFGERLQGVVLYGSEARGEARPDSDIDILALLEGPIDLGRDVHTATCAIYPLILETERVIDAHPVDIRDYRACSAPLYGNAQREGVAL